MKALITILSMCVITVWSAVFLLPDKKLHIVVCDVGQGDGILIYQGQTEIIIDGGLPGRMLPCLSRHRPFWDRTLDVVMVTHPQEDHFGGLIEVVESYTIDLFIENSHETSTQSYQLLQKALGDHRVPIKSAREVQTIVAGLMRFDILFPRPEDMGVVLSNDPNDTSITGKVTYGSFDGLFTGDMSPRLITYMALNNRLADIEYLKVPHHGSKNGTTKQLIDIVQPEISVISAGKNNRYGHPHKEVLDILSGSIYRTDETQDVEVVTDGKAWWVHP